MKKLLSILIALSLAAAFVYADETDDIMENLSKEELYEEQKTKSVEIVPKDQHLGDDKKAKVRMTYNPYYDEVRIYYTTSFTTFDQGEAMNAVLGCLQDFAKENGYTNYRYLIPPKTRNFIDKEAKPKMKYTEYFNHVQMIGKSNMKSIPKTSDGSGANAE
jgi:hypothetical protein